MGQFMCNVVPPGILLCIIFLFVASNVKASRTYPFYMPSLSACGRTREVDAAVISSSAQMLYTDSSCTLKLLADDSIFTTKRFMIKFESINIQDCTTTLKIYFYRSTMGRVPDYSFGCDQNYTVPPQMITTPGKYAIFRLDKKTNQGYEFRIVVTAFKTTGFCKDMFCNMDDRQCIDDDLRCDGVSNCPLGEDEKACMGLGGGYGRYHRFGLNRILGMTFTLFILLVSCSVCGYMCRRRRQSGLAPGGLGGILRWTGYSQPQGTATTTTSTAIPQPPPAYPGNYPMQPMPAYGTQGPPMAAHPPSAPVDMPGYYPPQPGPTYYPPPQAPPPGYTPSHNMTGYGLPPGDVAYPPPGGAPPPPSVGYQAASQQVKMGRP